MSSRHGNKPNQTEPNKTKRNETKPNETRPKTQTSSHSRQQKTAKLDIEDN
jgi:hypothetical protein